MKQKTIDRIYGWGAVAIMFCVWTPLFWFIDHIKSRYGSFDELSSAWSIGETLTFLFVLALCPFCQFVLMTFPSAPRKGLRNGEQFESDE